MIVFGEAHLRRILGKYAAYYESRIHRSLNKDDPFYRAIERVGAVTSSGGSRRRPCCHRPIRRRCCSGRWVTTAITLQDITIYPVVEQQGPFFDVMEFFPTLTKELPAIPR
jgi:hypothetical protein